MKRVRGRIHERNFKQVSSTGQKDVWEEAGAVKQSCVIRDEVRGEIAPLIFKAALIYEFKMNNGLNDTKWNVKGVALRIQRQLSTTLDYQELILAFFWPHQPSNLFSYIYTNIFTERCWYR